jgi:hypothetical protein
MTVPNEHSENTGTRKRRHPEEAFALDPLENTIKRLLFSQRCSARAANGVRRQYHLKRRGRPPKNGGALIQRRPGWVRSSAWIWLGSRISDQVLIVTLRSSLRIPRSEPICMTRLVADAASNSHPVAALSCQLRLRRARAQESGTILFFGFWSQAKSRSARLDPPELIGLRNIGGAGPQAASISAPSGTIPAVTYFQKAISSFRAKATTSTFRIRPPLNWTL